MKVGILAGGLGSRLGVESELRPKPMVEVGGMPLLWHIMKIYSHHGFNDFVVALGYKGEYIKRWMFDRVQASGDLSVDFSTGEIEQASTPTENFRVDLVETGLESGTGGRIRRLRDNLGPGTCMVTWGDGVSNLDINALLDFHRSHGRLATLTAVRPPARYGHLEFNGDAISSFTEKPQAAEGWVNGAFFVLEPGAFDYIEDDETMFEHAPLENLAKDEQLMAYRHEDFWQCMDTTREKKILNDLWDSGEAPWKVWS